MTKLALSLGVTGAAANPALLAFDKSFNFESANKTTFGPWNEILTCGRRLGTCFLILSSKFRSLNNMQFPQNGMPSMGQPAMDPNIAAAMFEKKISFENEKI